MGPSSDVWHLTPSGVSDPYPHSTHSVGVLRLLVQGVQLAGVPRDVFLQRAGIQESALDASEGRLARDDLFGYLGLALELTDPAFGLRWAAFRSERVFAPVKPLLAQCDTLAEALAMLAHVYRLLSDVCDYDVLIEGERVAIVSRPVAQPLPVQRVVAEMMMGGFLWLLRLYAPDARAHVSFAYPPPCYHEAYASLFGDAYRFDQPQTALLFDRAALDARAPERDEATRDALANLVEQRLHRITQGVPYSQRIREHVLREGWPKHTDMDSVADALGVSVRTLRRRLGEEGRSYQDVLNEALGTVATAFLRKPSTIRETAEAMGFSDANTFHRAFKRWTGTTPTAYLRSRAIPSAP